VIGLFKDLNQLLFKYSRELAIKVDKYWRLNEGLTREINGGEGLWQGRETGLVECLAFNMTLFRRSCELQSLCVDGSVIVNFVLEEATIKGVY
jgi:hypothetical protein